MNTLTHGPGCEKAPTIWANYTYLHINLKLFKKLKSLQKNINEIKKIMKLAVVNKKKTIPFSGFKLKRKQIFIKNSVVQSKINVHISCVRMLTT